MRDVVALLKPRYHASFLTVVISALLFADTITPELFARLAALYFSFTALFYGGIYTFNDIADRGADARHPRKRERPIASGRLGVPAAAALATLLSAAGVAIAIALF